MTLAGTFAALRVWSGFARTAIGATMGGGTVYLVAGVVALALLASVWVAGASEGKSRATAVCDVASLKKTIADQGAAIIEQEFAIKRFKERLAVAEDARRAAQRRTVRDAELVEQSKVKADAFKREIKSRPNRWTLRPDDARRLRAIGR